jgi:cardiolipin synthase
MEINVPNTLTLTRILVIPVICVLLHLATPIAAWLALAAYVYACVTDFLDGYIARAYQQQSSFGSMLDPIADKLLVASVLMVLVGIGRLSGSDIVAALIILCREIVVSGLREYLAQLQVSVPVTRLAKWKTSLQMIALGVLIVGDAVPPLTSPVGALTITGLGVTGLWLAAGLTLITGYDYFRAGLAHLTAANRPAASSTGHAMQSPAGDAR